MMSTRETTRATTMTNSKKTPMDDKAASRIKEADIKKPETTKDDGFPERAEKAAERNRKP